MDRLRQKGVIEHEIKELRSHKNFDFVHGSIPYGMH